MKKIINTLSRALENLCEEDRMSLPTALAARLHDGDLVWIEKLPVSIVNRRDRVKNRTLADRLSQQHFFDHDGVSISIWKRQLLDAIVKKAVDTFQIIDLAVTKDRAQFETLVFHTKRPNDYWKRLQNIDAIDGMVGLRSVDQADCSDSRIEDELAQSSNGQWSVESDLRDAMRSKKENSGLREKPFIWVIVTEKSAATGDDHLLHLLQHYFGANTHKHFAKVDFYIGYIHSLDTVSLRTFYKKK